MTYRFAMSCMIAAGIAFTGSSAMAAGSGQINGWAAETQSLLEQAMKDYGRQELAGQAVVNVRVDARGEVAGIDVVKADADIARAARTAITATVSQMPRLPAALRGKPVIVQFLLTYDVAGAGMPTRLQELHQHKVEAALASNSAFESTLAGAAGEEAPKL